MNIGKLVKSLSPAKLGRKIALREKIGKTDLGVLKVAFLVAAIDGDVTDAEYKAFDQLAKRCRGCTEEAAKAALQAAMRSAGYLLLLSARVTETKLVRAFMKEAKSALPNGFAYYALEDVRRAIVTWMAMGMSDGDYSARERRCLEALRRDFAEQKVMKLEQDAMSCLAMTPSYCETFSCGGSVSANAVADGDAFVRRVEDIVRELGDSTEATKLLNELVANG